MKEIALARNIPVLQPESINTPEGVQALQSVRPDLLVVAAFGQILSRDVLATAAHGGINVHASLLPKYRGGDANCLGDLSWRDSYWRDHYPHVDSSRRGGYPCTRSNRHFA